MQLANVLSLLGGLALFLYGMHMMSSGLEAAAGNRMKSILEKLTANRFLGVAVGAGITAVIQSSSATTVMVVGFVNSGLMSLRQAVWIIMGANIGTTITGQLIALDVGALAPLMAFAGVALVVFFKNPKLHNYGSIVAGLGVLFIGMDMMSAAMKPLADEPAFVSLMTRFENPILGILAGAAFTALIQSSSASVGILQALAASGAISFSSAVFVLFGQNIGTCITAVLASIGTSRNAKRTTLIHLMFNIIGTIIFTIVCVLFPLPALVASFTPENIPSQIANMHTLFNIVTTLLLLPLGTQMAALTERILPEPAEKTEEEKREMMGLAYLDKTTLGSSAVWLGKLQQELGRMLDLASENVDAAFQAVISGPDEKTEKAIRTEELVDLLNKEISQYVAKAMVRETNAEDSAAVASGFRIAGNIERIGDHAMNILGYGQRLEKENIQLSDDALKELMEMRAVCAKALRYLHGDSRLDNAAKLEQTIDDMTTRFRENHMHRMKNGECSDEGCILYSEILTDFERVGDHVLNIAQELSRTAQVLA
ncbi:MAG: Na/Pi cotransporter family protein [Fournierella sp.]|uniref:Na/Pi cotransporter family protein n=1 Tax=Allofournierella sp. TaxID=1940256 RepID=UPI002A7F1137|nr:Na/Pi cotransporter family protein [Fournierella sp.]MDY4168150.1 Na/Pi cotransporter family protein [Fournierella sp.]